jgi:membrane associated rhomboid family serine protease
MRPMDFSRSKEPTSQPAMQPQIDTLKSDNVRLRRAFILSASFVLLLWIIKLVEILFGLDLVQYGVYPLRFSGLAGILTAPLIHGSLSHLFSNTAPLLILGTALLYGYPRSANIVIPVLYLGAGLGVWLFARSAYHIGASGLSFGMMFFIFTIGILRWDKRAIVLSMVVFFLYGSMIWGIFPGRPGVSFESHFFGAAIGIALAVVLKHRDPIPEPKKYSWEEETEDQADEEQTDR